MMLNLVLNILRRLVFLDVIVMLCDTLKHTRVLKWRFRKPSYFGGYTEQTETQIQHSTYTLIINSETSYRIKTYLTAVYVQMAGDTFTYLRI